MKLEEKLVSAEQENAKLKADNEMLLEVIVQMKITLNRLINRYMTENPE